MLDSPTQSTCVRRWELAGTNLAAALSTYVDSCLGLSTGRVETAQDSKHLASQIDHTLENLHVQLGQQIAQSRYTLARVRNQLAGTFCSIPEEILAEIFTLVVYDRSDCEVRFIEDDMRAHYRRLHALMAVCTAWQKVGTSHGAFWTLIPMISRKSGWMMRSAAERSYERAGSRELYLGASVEKHVDSKFVECIERNFHRFRSINLVFDNTTLLGAAIPQIFEGKSLVALTELSLYHILGQSQEFGTNAPGYSHSIEATARTLRVLRLKNVHINWRFITMPRLVELRVESVIIGSKVDFKRFLYALRAAPQLQKLELISLTTITGPNDTTTPRPIHMPLPELQRLHIGDLYSDDAETILRSIANDSYHITLYLDSKMASTEEPDGSLHMDLDRLMLVLKDLKVDELLLYDDGESAPENWLDPEELRNFLQVMPLIATLKIDRWLFEQNELEALIRPHDGSAFAKLQFIQFSNARLNLPGEESMWSLQNLLYSHPIQRFVLGGTVEIPCLPSRGLDRVSIKNCDQLADWLEPKVPELKLLDDDYIPSEFRTHHWELW